MTRQDDLAAVAVYRDKDYVGAVVERTRGRWQAIDAAGKVIGTFPKMIAARDAVLEAHPADAGSVR